MSKISFSTKLIDVESKTVLVFPLEESRKLPSRGMVVIDGKIDGISFQSALEPDGRGSHWFEVPESLLKKLNKKKGSTVSLSIDVSEKWPDPNVPKDLKDALSASSKAHKLWEDITPNARWDWVRWIRGTQNDETRKRRINVTLSKLKKGMRRPCCFNRSMCTDPTVSKNGLLLVN